MPKLWQPLPSSNFRILVVVIKTYLIPDSLRCMCRRNRSKCCQTQFSEDNAVPTNLLSVPWWRSMALRQLPTPKAHKLRISLKNRPQRTTLDSQSRSHNFRALGGAQFHSKRASLTWYAI